MESEAEVLLQVNDHYDSYADSVTYELYDSIASPDKNSEDKLINSYEEALSLSNIDIAKIIARSTCKNKKGSSGAPPHIPNKDKQQPNSSSKKSKSKKKKKWDIGTHCRAVYSRDGLEYEAIVSKVISSNERAVTFVGYNNTQIVETCALKPSLGVEVQAQQILEADDIGVEEYPGDNKYDDDDNELIDIPRKKPRPKSSHKKRKHKTQKCGSDHEHSEPAMPFMPQMPGLSSKLKLPFMPLMPPPQLSESDEHLYSMLMSWYMSGYYTGLYQGMKRNSSTSTRKH